MGFGKFCNLLSHLFNWVFQGNSLSIHLTAITDLHDLGFVSFDDVLRIRSDGIHHHLGKYFWMCFFPTTEQANSKCIPSQKQILHRKEMLDTTEQANSKCIPSQKQILHRKEMLDTEFQHHLRCIKPFK